MKSSILIIVAVVFSTFTACKKDPTTPTTTKPVSVDSCGCEQQVHRGYNLASTNPYVGGTVTHADTIYWKFPMKDTNTLCKGSYFSDTLRIYYIQHP